jgi:hypothetical protein
MRDGVARREGMRLRRPRPGVLSASAAVGGLAAALLTAACSEQVDLRGSSPSAAEAVDAAADTVAALTTRWLVPPDPGLDPPLAAPVSIELDARRRRLFVLELQPPELRVYDLLDGRLVAGLGREGDGPGEYRHPIDLAVSGGGLAAVLSVSGRVTYWGPDASLAGVVRSGGGLATDIVAARGDSFYVKADRFPPEDVAEFRVVTCDSVLDRPRYRDSGLAGTEEPGRALRNHSYAVAATANGDLLLAPPGQEYLILRIGPEGKLRQRIRRPEIAPLQRSEEEVEAIRERIRRGFAAAGRAVPTRLQVPLYRSHVARLAVAPDGTIWALTQRGDSDVAVIDRFDEDGRFSGSYRVVLRVSELAVGHDAIYLLAHSALDVPGIAVAPRPRSRGADG